MRLARAGAEGDSEAVQQLLVLLAPRLRGVVRAVLGANHPAIDDAQQQTLIGLVRSLPRFRGDCEPFYFASRIAARTALCIARKNRSASERLDDRIETEEAEAIDGEAPGWTLPHESLEKERRRQLLRDLLARLAPEQAEALTLRVVLGWSHDEIALATDAPLNTVRSRIRLAKGSLRRWIEDDRNLSDELGPR